MSPFLRTRSGRPSAARRGRLLALVGAVAAVAGLAAAPSASAASGGGNGDVDHVRGRLHATSAASERAPQALLRGPVHYAVNRPLCARPATPTAAACFAVRRVDVAKGTPGSYAYSQRAATLGPAGGYTPADLARAYGFNPAVHRQYQTVAVVNWFDDPHALADLNRFDAHYHLPRETSRSFRKVNQRGKTAPLPRPNRSSAGETALDLQAIRGVCHTCRILLVEADRGSDVDLATAENTAVRLGADEISNSFGSIEHKVSAKVRAAFNHPGVVITAATGDSGWYGWDEVNARGYSPNRPSYPASDPHVIAVGGTTLKLTSSGRRASESVWNGNLADDSRGIDRGSPQGASGGGCSHLFAAPAWQRKHPGYAAAGCGGKRLAADVSVLADPSTGYDVVNTYAPAGYPHWLTIGGTSLSSPVIAAMYALAGGAHGAAYPAASLYLNGTHRKYSVFDVTVGGNAFCGGDTTQHCGDVLSGETRPVTHSPNNLGAGITDCSFPRRAVEPARAPVRRSECNATKGYDGPSGVGAPRSLGFFTATNPRVSLAVPKHVHDRHRASFTAHAKEPLAGPHVTGYAWNFGDGSGAGGSRPGVHHTYHRAGTYRLTLTVGDSAGQLVQVVRTVKVT